MIDRQPKAASKYILLNYMKPAKKVYAVKVGRKPGYYYSWDECNEQVFMYGGAVFKSFKRLKDAQNWMMNKKITPLKIEKLRYPKKIDNSQDQITLTTIAPHVANFIFSGNKTIGAFFKDEEHHKDCVPWGPCVCLYLNEQDLITNHLSSL